MLRYPNRQLSHQQRLLRLLLPLRLLVLLHSLRSLLLPLLQRENVQNSVVDRLAADSPKIEELLAELLEIWLQSSRDNCERDFMRRTVQDFVNHNPSGSRKQAFWICNAGGQKPGARNTSCCVAKHAGGC